MQCYIKKIVILSTCLALILFICNSVHAATITWTGGGSDNLVSNPLNWSDGLAPQEGDKIVFDGTSIKNCIWDLPVTLSALTKYAGYTGRVTKASGVNLRIAKFRTWTGGGADNLASNPANWLDNIVPQNGDKVLFDGTSAKDCIWDINSVPAFIKLTGYAGTVTLDTALAINGNLTILSGMLDLNNKDLSVGGYLAIGVNGSLNATSSTIAVAGDWLNDGNFYYGYSTVILNGTGQAIYGSTTFYNLIKTVTAADTLFFEAGSTQTVINNLILRGTSGNLLSLRSTVDGSYWYINALGTRNVAFADIKDLNNISGTSIIAVDSVDSGNNVNVPFDEDQCVSLDHDLLFDRVLSADRRATC